MHSPHDEFQALRTRTEDYYKSIGHCRCPALNADVNFTSDGFHHLRFDGARSERSKVVQASKLRCVKDAVSIVRKTTTTQEYRVMTQAVGKPAKDGFRKTSRVEYYAFQAIVGDVGTAGAKRIRVVIRRIGDGAFHFWSVMPRWTSEQVNSAQYARQIGSPHIVDE